MTEKQKAIPFKEVVNAVILLGERSGLETHDYVLCLCETIALMAAASDQEADPDKLARLVAQTVKKNYVGLRAVKEHLDQNLNDKGTLH